MQRSELVRLILETSDHFDRQNMASYAAAIAYHGIISMGPLLLFSITVASMFVGQDVATDEFIRSMTAIVGPDIAPLIADVALELSQPTTNNLIFALVWLCITFYAASNVFRHLVVALDTVWDVERPRIDKRLSFLRRQFIRLRKYIVGLVAALSIIFVLLISLIARTIVDALWESIVILTPQFATLFSIVSYLVIPLILATFCLLAFKLLPNVRIPWRDVWLGAVVTGIVLTITETIIGYFASRAYIATFYGAAGSVVVLMLWAYFSVFIVLMGAESTKVFSYIFGSRSPAYLERNPILNRETYEQISSSTKQVNEEAQF